MDLGLAGRRVLVTGAARGIGRAVAIAFGAEGARVAINDRRPGAELDAVCAAVAAAGGEATALAMDVASLGAADEMVGDATRALGGLDVLVNNAAVVLVRPLLDTSDADWAEVLATNLTAPFRLCRAVVAGMRAQGGGCIVNVVSELAWLGRADYAAYTATKGGLVSLTRSLARELAPAIRVNAVAPGPTDTPMLASELTTPALRARELDIPLRRLAEPEEVAASVVFLASERARFYCGEIVSPNGGALMR